MIVLRGSLFDNFFHHYFELREIDRTIAIQINFSDNFGPNLLGWGHIVTQNCCDFSSVYCTAAIFIEKIEGGAHVRLIEQLLQIDCMRAPLTKVDRPASISVSLVKNLIR